MPDFVKSNDRQFQAQAALFLAVVSAAPGVYSVGVGETETFQTLLAALGTGLDQHEAARDMARSKTDQKNAARAALEKMYRSLNARIQSDGSVDAAEKAAAGLPVHAPGRSPMPVPTARPMLEVAQTGGGQHVVRFFDAETGKRARPADARSIVLYRKVVAAGTTPPAGPEDMEQVNAFTATKAVLNYPGVDIGKQAYYLARYANTRNQTGPAGAVVGATIAA